MFERLSDGFSNALKKISGKGTISEANIREAVEEVRTALLEADVQYDVAKAFCERVVERALGQDVTKSLRPGQEFIGVVHRELVELLSGGGDAENVGVVRVDPGPTVVMMCGLQGSGKTTTCGKLAGYLKKRGRSVMLVAADLQRPAAVDQLRLVSEQVRDELPGGATVAFYSEPEKARAYGEAVGAAVEVCKRAVKEARSKGIDTVILDTAGRLHVDDELMGELRSVRASVGPHQTFLVVDAMTGQDAVASARTFHEQLSVDGCVLTKFDSDTRGGAAISIREVTGAPVVFIGVGEHLDAIEEFHPERIAGRILGMGDVVSLVEKAQEQVSEEEAKELEEKMGRGELSMDDFLKQLRMLRRMGSMKSLMGMLPGVGSALKDVNIDDKELDRVEGMIRSMTAKERADTTLMNNSRRRRIARGAGVEQNDVGKLVKQFDMMSKMGKQLAGLGAKGKMKAMQQLQAAGGGEGGAGMAGWKGRASTQSRSPKAGFKKRKKR